VDKASARPGGLRCDIDANSSSLFTYDLFTFIAFITIVIIDQTQWVGEKTSTMNCFVVGYFMRCINE